MTNKSLKPSLYKIFTDNAFHQLPHLDNWLTSLHNLVRRGAAIESTQEIVASKGINLSTDFKDILLRIKSATGNPITLTANPQISGGVDGQKVAVEGSDDTATVELVNGNGLKLAGAVSFILAKNDMIDFQYNATESLYIEKSRSKNS